MKLSSRIWIVGAGGFGSECEAVLRSKGISIAGYLDDINPECVPIDKFEPAEEDQIVVAIGEPRDREQVVERLKGINGARARFHGILFNWAAYNSRVGGGCVFLPNTIVSAHAQVGDFVHVGFASLVGHHVQLGDFCTLSSQVDLTGHVRVGRGVFFGSGARVLPRVEIGDYATIGAGAVVIKDVEPGTTVFGNPAARVWV